MRSRRTVVRGSVCSVHVGGSLEGRSGTRSCAAGRIRTTGSAVRGEDVDGRLGELRNSSGGSRVSAAAARTDNDRDCPRSDGQCAGLHLTTHTTLGGAAHLPLTAAATTDDEVGDGGDPGRWSPRCRRSCEGLETRSTRRFVRPPGRAFVGRRCGCRRESRKTHRRQDQGESAGAKDQSAEHAMNAKCANYLFC